MLFLHCILLYITIFKDGIRFSYFVLRLYKDFICFCVHNSSFTTFNKILHKLFISMHSHFTIYLYTGDK